MNKDKSKIILYIFCFCVSCLTAWIVPNYFSHSSETLSLVSLERQIIYTLWFGISFMIFGEMIGVYAIKSSDLINRSFLFFLFASSLAGLSLISVIWILEYEFVGRLTVFKTALSTGLFSFIFISLQNWYTRKNKPLCLLMVSKSLKINISNQLKRVGISYDWVDYKDEKDGPTLHEFCVIKGVGLLVVECDSELSGVDVIRLLSDGVRIINLREFCEINFEKIPPSLVNHSWLIGLDLRLRDPLLHKIKRMFDIVFGISGFLLSLPILIFFIFLIAVGSGFPVFYSQTRSGFLGREYVLYKLRTMRRDAEKDGAKWACNMDSRITTLGKFLRKWRIDEIPQFWNVIKGEMSIVGPRPERPEFQQTLMQQIPHWNCRYLVKPGLTGWAQIRFRYASDMKSSEEKLSYDLYYIKNASILMDIQIILSTLRTIAKGSR